jgi:hypothetical protein
MHDLLFAGQDKLTVNSHAISGAVDLPAFKKPIDASLKESAAAAKPATARQKWFWGYGAADDGDVPCDIAQAREIRGVLEPATYLTVTTIDD